MDRMTEWTEWPNDVWMMIVWMLIHRTMIDCSLVAGQARRAPLHRLRRHRRRAGEPLAPGRLGVMSVCAGRRQGRGVIVHTHTVASFGHRDCIMQLRNVIINFGLVWIYMCVCVWCEYVYVYGVWVYTVYVCMVIDENPKMKMAGYSRPPTRHSIIITIIHTRWVT